MSKYDTMEDAQIRADEINDNLSVIAGADMTDVLFTYSISDFELRPKMRLTQGQVKLMRIPRHKVRASSLKKWDQIKKYLDHVSAVTHLFFIAWDGKPPLEGHMIISWAVHLPHKRGVDSDNIDKQIRDCLQNAGVVTNDKLIRGTDKTRLWQKKRGPARMAVTLKRLKCS